MWRFHSVGDACNAGRVIDVGEVAADEKATRALDDLPHTIYRVGVGVPVEEFAGVEIEREQLFPSGCVRVVAAIRIAVLGEVRVW